MLICCIVIAPTDRPGNFAVIAINSSSVSLSWTEPNKSVLHGILQRYAIQYTRVQCKESNPVIVANQEWNKVNVTNTTVSLIISNLRFWSCYDFKIMAVTIRDGPFSSNVSVRTKEHGMLSIISLHLWRCGI